MTFQRRNVTISLDPDSLKWIDGACESFGCPKSALINAAIGYLRSKASDEEIRSHVREYRESLPGSPWRKDSFNLRSPNKH